MCLKLESRPWMLSWILSRGVLVRCFHSSSHTAHATSFLLDTAISSAVLELKFLVQNQFSQAPTHDGSYSPFHIISSLASKLPEIKHPAARACVVWMVGQYSAVDIAEFCTEGAGLNGVAYWVPDVLREVTREFAGEVR